MSETGAADAAGEVNGQHGGPSEGPKDDARERDEPPVASLYIGDLALDVTESMLLQKFSPIGPIVSLRVFSDPTKGPLGFAFVNFAQRNHAEIALMTMNCDPMGKAGLPMRIMWYQKDTAVRRTDGNVFIKNLHPAIDDKHLLQTMSVFGDIQSCKIARDVSGNSKGFGFIQFTTEEAAQNAINQVNGLLLCGKSVYVAKHIPRTQRDAVKPESAVSYSVADTQKPNISSVDGAPGPSMNQIRANGYEPRPQDPRNYYGNTPMQVRPITATRFPSTQSADALRGPIQQQSAGSVNYQSMPRMEHERMQPREQPPFQGNYYGMHNNGPGQQPQAVQFPGPAFAYQQRQPAFNPNVTQQFNWPQNNHMNMMSINDLCQQTSQMNMGNVGERAGMRNRQPGPPPGGSDGYRAYPGSSHNQSNQQYSGQRNILRNDPPFNNRNR